MKNIKKIIQLCHESWLNDEKIPETLVFSVQSKIDNLIYEENLAADISSHYLLLSDFKQSEKFAKLSYKLEIKRERLIDEIEFNRKGCILLNQLTY